MSSSADCPPKADLPRIAVVGCGRWGKNLVRTFHRLEALSTVCDANNATLTEALALAPNALASTSFEDVLEDPLLDGVVLATPSHTHAALALKALQARKHVYVEKPLATNTQDVDGLIAEAQAANLTLMVGHLLLYHPAVHRLKALVAEGALGDILTVTSTRLNFNAARPDTSVLWDLAPHDLSLMAEVLGREAVAIDRVDGVASGWDGKVDHARLTVRFEGSPAVKGEVVNSWVYPVKAVQLSVIGNKAVAVLDDTQPERKLILVDRASGQVSYPDVLNIEPLLMECQHFIHCIQTGNTPNTHAQQGRQIVALLEEAHQRLQPSLLLA